MICYFSFDAITVVFVYVTYLLTDSVLIISLFTFSTVFSFVALFTFYCNHCWWLTTTTTPSLHPSTTHRFTYIHLSTRVFRFCKISVLFVYHRTLPTNSATYLVLTHLRLNWITLLQYKISVNRVRAQLTGYSLEKILKLIQLQWMIIILE